MLLKVARASWPIATDCPAPKVAVIVPSEAITMLSIVPGAAPFCRMDDVAEAVAKPVSVKLPFGSTMFQDNELAAAPSVHVGVVMVTSAGAPPLTDVSCPVGPNPNVPAATGNGVPAVPPVTSAPGPVT